MNFNRSRTQMTCENFSVSLGCSVFAQFDLKKFSLTTTQASTIHLNLIDDSKDFYFKGILSLFEAIKSIHSGLFSWATIKLYYSTYYLLRSTMALYDIAIVRQKGFFYLKAIPGETPQKKNGKKYRTDHDTTIHLFIDLFSSNDILLSQNIDSIYIYEWLKDRREQINYKERIFNEPNCSTFWDQINNSRKKNDLDKLIINYIQDNRYIFCFQEDHAILAAPLKRAILTKKIFDDMKINISLSPKQQKVLLDLLPFKIGELIDLTK